eukprot:8781795-Pyramimonas_sp.AAC.1
MGRRLLTVTLLAAMLASGDALNPIRFNGEQAVSLSDPRVVSAAQFAADTVEAQSNSLEKYALQSVLAAQPLFLEGGALARETRALF